MKPRCNFPNITRLPTVRTAGSCLALARQEPTLKRSQYRLRVCEITEILEGRVERLLSPNVGRHRGPDIKLPSVLSPEQRLATQNLKFNAEHH